jgi:hypothetical protein
MTAPSKYIIAVIVLSCFWVALLIHRCSPEKVEPIKKPQTGRHFTSGDSSLPSHVVIERNGGMTAFLDAFESPIELYGKVIDQHGDPVSGASITLTPTDSPFGDGSRSKTVIVSDSQGEFSVRGLKGASIGVRAEKADYMDIPRLGGPASSATLGYSGDSKSGKTHSNPATPLVLKLHKVGPTEPMVYVERKNWKLPVDGSPRRISLDSEDGNGEHQIEFRFWSDWSKLPKDNEINSKRYEWTFEARVPGGGFVWNDGGFNFEAPESGYKELIRYHNPSDLPREKWKRVQHGRYFVKFPDGTHARIEFDIDGSTDWSPLRMASWMSLKPGSRNLSSPLKSSHIFQGDDPETK